MTRKCDSCGGAIDMAHPFATCPKCLFGEALSAVDYAPGVEPAAAESGPGPPPSIPGLPIRADFFKKYDLIRRLDGGGQGDIWEVWDAEFRRTVAMKRLARADGDSEAVVSRFFAEAQIASQLEHPGILPIFDVGRDPDGRPFYTTQLLPKGTLENVWKQLRDPAQAEWTQRRALELLLQICAVMAYAHGRGVIHRDLKPSNILVGPFGEVRVIDWGSARLQHSTRLEQDAGVVATDRHDLLASPAGSAQSTASSGLPMTALFTPPEILNGQTGAFGPATDIYSMGVMLYELLAGRPPYSDADGVLPPVEELRELIKAGPPEPVRHVRPSVSRDLAAICAKAMAHDMGGRYLSMEELADDFRAFLEIRPVHARNPGPLLRLQKLVLRNLSYVVLFTLILAGAAVATTISRQLKVERDTARLRDAMSDAQLASRSGRWPQALALWRHARTLPGHDPVEIGLRLAEAHIVLSDKPNARAELNLLLRRPDLGERRAAVLLRVGEHEMFDRATFGLGVSHVREALTNGLTAADAALARGLLADSTPAALAFFRDALKLDPYFHSAHRHSLGLEFALGRHDELASHLRAVKALYPGDFSPGAIEVAELAVLGRRDEALAALAAYHGNASPETLARLERGVRFLANVVDYFDLEVYLGERTNAISKSALVGEATQLFLARGMGDSTNASQNPLPQLPCVEQGIGTAFEAVKALAMARLLGGAARTEEAVQRIRESWKRHPEALFPVFAGVFLDHQQPRAGPRDTRLLLLQSELYQMGADSPSILPNLNRLSLLLALDVQEELARGTNSNALTLRTNCVANLRRAATDTNLPPVACRAFAKWAVGLEEYDLARVFFLRWETLQPSNPSLWRNRVRADLEAGAFGPALKRLGEPTAGDPTNQWTTSLRRQLARKVAEMNDLLNPPTNSSAAAR